MDLLHGRRGVGIQSLHGRVEQIGGRLTIRTTPQGATVTADLPLALGDTEGGSGADGSGATALSEQSYQLDP
ncbi:hypothetical protein ACWC09_04890 [Streptomyces sp. NPDC001617]